MFKKKKDITNWKEKYEELFTKYRRTLDQNKQLQNDYENKYEECYELEEEVAILRSKIKHLNYKILKYE